MFIEMKFPPGTYDPDRGRRGVLVGSCALLQTFNHAVIGGK